METVAIIDFESTGEPTSRGGRATEVAIILTRQGRPVDSFQSLMNAGAWITPFAEALTGISNEMIESAPSARRVMAEARKFVGALPMVAHNAAFDSALWAAEIARLGDEEARNAFACTMLLSRRVYPSAPDHKLGTLARHMRFAPTGRAHRAMVDTEMAAALWARIQESVRARHGLAEAPHAFLARAQKIPKAAFHDKLPSLAAQMGVPERSSALWAAPPPSARK